MKYTKTLLALTLLCVCNIALATNPPNPCGNHGNNCNPTTPTTPVTGEQQQDQNQHQSNQQGQGQGQAQNATGTGTGLGVGVGYGTGGDSSSVANGGHATGGNALSGSQSGATSGSLSGVQGSGNADVRTNTTIGPVGSTSASGSLSGAAASNGDQSTSVRNGSESSSGAVSGDVSGTNTNTTSSTGGTSSANGIVSVDAADRSSTTYQNSTRVNTFIPGDLPSNAMTIAPGASITVAGDQACGVLVSKVEIPVYQWNKRGTKKVQVGYDEDVVPYKDASGVQQDYQTVNLPNGGYYLRGNHVTYVLSTQGSSTSSQLGLQGGGSGGYGGLSFGSGRSYSQAGVRVIIRPCIAEKVDALPVIEYSKPRIPRG